MAISIVSAYLSIDILHSMGDSHLVYISISARSSRGNIPCYQPLCMTSNKGYGVKGLLLTTFTIRDTVVIAGNSAARVLTYEGLISEYLWTAP